MESRETKSKLKNLESKVHNEEKRLETVMDRNYLSREGPCYDTILGNKGK